MAGNPIDLLHHLDSWILERRENLDELLDDRRKHPDNDYVRALAAHLEKLLADETIRAMRLLVGQVSLALGSHEDPSERGRYWVDDVLWLAGQLEDRRRRRWLHEVRDAIASKHGPAHAAEILVRRLCVLDEKAKSLSVADLAKHLKDYGTLKGQRTRIKSADGLAARIAVDCGAFGYTSSKFRVAKTAFAKLLKERNREYN